MLLPGAGQLYVGARRRGLILLGSPRHSAGRLRVAAVGPRVVDRRLVAALLAVDLALLAFRLFAVVDVWRGGAPRHGGARRAHRRAACRRRLRDRPQLQRARERLRGRGARGRLRDGVLSSPTCRRCRATSRRTPGNSPSSSGSARARWRRSSARRGCSRTRSPRTEAVDDDPPARHRRGPGQLRRAHRHDHPRRRPARHRPRRRLRDPAQPRAGAARRKRKLVQGAAQRPLRAQRRRRAGASALKQAVSNLLGIRVDYYALVNLLGFADLVDALGGVEIEVKERLVDEVTRPAWGEPKPRIDVVPGRTYRFYGREALAYVRSRKDSSDYTRMARQRCFLSALADQLDPVRVLRNFGSLAKTVETNVHTDIPLNRLPRSSARQLGRPEGDADGHVRADYFFGRQRTATIRSRISAASRRPSARRS